MGKGLRKRGRKLDALVARDGPCCRYCGRPLDRKRMTVDHVTPRSKGGSGHLGNLQILCRPCNEAKGDGGLRRWARLRHLPRAEIAMHLERLQGHSRDAPGPRERGWGSQEERAAAEAATLEREFLEKLSAQKRDEDGFHAEDCSCAACLPPHGECDCPECQDPVLRNWLG